MRVHLSMGAITAVVLFAACTHTQAYVATGESLVTLGETFVATGHLMDSALDKGAVTPEQYRRWAAFAHYFKPTYDVAADRWLHSDDTAAQHAAAVLAALSAELAGWVAIAGGSP